MALRSECLAILDRLSQLGLSKPEALMSLVQRSVPPPGLPNEQLYSVVAELLNLKGWFEKKSEKELQSAMETVPSDALAFRVFLQVRETVHLLNRITPLQLLHLSNGVVPPGPDEVKYNFLRSLQETLQHWNVEQLEQMHGVIHSTPVHLERQRMAEYRIRPDQLHIVCELLKLPLEQLVSFHGWFCSLALTALKRCAAFLQMDSPTLLELRTQLYVEQLQAPMAGGVGGAAGNTNADGKLRVPGAWREDLMGLSTGFSPPAAVPTHMAGPMKTSVGSLDLGAPVAMDIGFGEELAEFLQKDGSDPLGLRSLGSGGSSGGLPFGNSSGGLSGMAGWGNGSSGNSNNNSNNSSGSNSNSSVNNSNSVNSSNNNAAQSFGAPPAVAPPPPGATSASTQQRRIRIALQNDNLSNEPPANVKKEKGRGKGSKRVNEDEDSDEMMPDVDDDGDDGDGDDPDNLVPPAIFQSAGPSEGGGGFQLRIVVQPSAKTVYQRILRPYPAVLLEGAVPGVNFFVDLTLVGTDDEAPLSCITGVSKMRISNGLFATFKRLKITSTSQQVGSLFRLRFALKSFDGSSYTDVPGVVALSQPVEVFSHTHYLTNKKKSHKAGVPTITDVIPSAMPCTGGGKVVILGADFVRCAQLKVKVGSVVVPANFHEAGTLWIFAPPMPAGRYQVQASNDGLFWTSSPVYLEYV